MSIFFHRGSIEDFIRRCPVSSILVFLNTVVFIAILITGGTLSQESYSYLYELGVLFYGAIGIGEYYRLLTAMFLHADGFHYIFNTLFGILIISAGLEKLIGSYRFAIVYFVSGLVSSIVINFIPTYAVTLGASGAIYGGLGFLLYIIVFKNHFLIESDIRYLVTLLIINGIFTFINPSISIAGHVSGLVMGFLLGFVVLIGFKRRIFYM